MENMLSISNNFSSEAAWPMLLKFHVEPFWSGGTKDCLNGCGLLTKMAAVPLYDKNFKNHLLQNQESLWA